MIKKLSSLVGSENSSDSPLDLKAYSYASSDAEALPSMVLWPQSVEQVRRVLLYANQFRIPIVIRGSGTNTVNGTIGEGSVILCSERLNKILKIDSVKKTVEVEAGVRIAELNRVLNEFNLIFPLIPLNPVSTIGGMIALNVATKESHRLGRMEAWVEEVEFVDGTGKYFYTSKKEVVAGKEGLSGFITRAKLRVVEQQNLSFDLFNSDHLSEILKKTRELEKDVEVYFVEFFDKTLSEVFGFKNNYCLVVAYTSLKGKNRTLPETSALLKKVDLAHTILREKGRYHIEDAFVSLDKSYDLVVWCEKNNVAVQGHSGLGLFYAYFFKEDDGLVLSFRSFLKSINGKAGKLLGCGTKNTAFLTTEEKKQFIKLKDEHDYNNILNAGKIIDYR